MTDEIKPSENNENIENKEKIDNKNNTMEIISNDNENKNKNKMEIVKELKEEEENEVDQNENNLELEDIDLNNIFYFDYNYDVLKLIISNLIKNQKKINIQLAELKLDKINKEKRADELESTIIDLKILREDSNQIKKDLQEQKNKLISKEYQNQIDSILKEKGILLQSLDNMKKNNNKKNLLNLKDLVNNKSSRNNDLDKEILNNLNNMKKEFSENLEKIEIFRKEMIEEMNKQIDDIKSKFEETKSKMISNEKDFLLMKKTIKNTEDKLDIKFTQDMPKLIEKIFYSKITSMDSKVMQMEENFQQKYAQLKNEMDNNLIDLNKNIQEKNEEIEQKIKENTKKINSNEKGVIDKIKTLYEKLNEYLLLIQYKVEREEIEEKINNEKKLLNNELTNLKNIIRDFISDKTDHDNLVTLSKRFEIVSAITYKNQEMQEEFLKEKKKLQNFDPKKFVELDPFEEFKNNIYKLVTSFQKDFQDIKSELFEINNKNMGTKASIRDLKSLEDNVFVKIDELYNIIKEKYAEKNLISKNNKIMEIKIKHLLDEYRKNERSDAWLLSKKPIGHLCASCEAYLGDLKDNSTNTKYIPWNKYPTKDPIDKLYRVGAGFSKILQMVNPDTHKNKNKATKNSFLNEVVVSPKNEQEEESNSLTKDKMLINNSINYEQNNSGIQMDKGSKTARVNLPNLLNVNNSKKNLTFTNFYNENCSEEIPKKIQNYNNTIKYNNVNVNNNKNIEQGIKKIDNIEMEKDEIIHLPNSPSPHLIRKIFTEEKKGPKITKIIKKGNTDIRSNNRKRIVIKDKVIN